MVYICAPGYKELLETVHNVLEGHMLRKNPREQMTNREIPHVFHTQTLNPSLKDGVTLTFSIPRYGVYWCSQLKGTSEDCKQCS
jgi:hypothetical protein